MSGGQTSHLYDFLKFLGGAVELFGNCKHAYWFVSVCSTHVPKFMFVGQSSWFYELLKNSRGRYGAIGKVQVRKYVRLSLLYMCIKFHACSRNQLFYMNFWKILGGAVKLFGQAQVLGDSLSSSWWSFFYIWSCTVKLRAFHSSWPDDQNVRPATPTSCDAATRF